MDISGPNIGHFGWTVPPFDGKSKLLGLNSILALPLHFSVFKYGPQTK